MVGNSPETYRDCGRIFELKLTPSRFVVVKNPLSPAEHPGGLGVDNELFEQSLEQFVVW